MLSSLSKKLPPKSSWQSIEELAKTIKDPVRKLRFLKQAVGDKIRETPGKDNDPSLTTIDSPALDRDDSAAFPHETVQDHSSSNKWIYQYRHVIVSAILVISLWVAGIGIMSLIGMINTIIINDAESEIPEKNRTAFFPVDISRRLAKAPGILLSRKKTIAEKQAPAYLDKLIWLVEETPGIEFYSNRLQIITKYTVDNIPRSYYRFEKDVSGLPSQDQVEDRVIGVLYHASESDIFDYKPEMTSSIKRYSRALIKYLCKKKSYHYFIDRFGQVYRIVREDHAAFHGGNSIWADDESIYLNLNHAFIGICFEGRDFENNQTKGKGDKVKDGEPKILMMSTSSINEAQIRSGKELTDLLRVKYQIHQQNCVPHSIASVNADALLIGHHLDLSYGFPFEEYGLSNKYNEPLPSMTLFGFSYDRYFEKIFNSRKWPAIGISEAIIKKEAKKDKMTLPVYRKMLNKKFTRYFQWQKEQKEKKASTSG